MKHEPEPEITPGLEGNAGLARTFCLMTRHRWFAPYGWNNFRICKRCGECGWEV